MAFAKNNNNNNNSKKKLAYIILIVSGIKVKKSQHKLIKVMY